MVNTKHDTASYENCGCKREIFDGNLLYESFLRAKQGSDWKTQVQKFEMNYLFELANLQRELESGDYKFQSSTEFALNERGKARRITGEQIKDRVAKHALCDEILTPAVRKYLIYDNGASLKGKGIDFTRRRLLVHLRKYYQKHKSNDGYILLIDFSKYYDNIRHDRLMEQFEKYITDDRALDFLRKVIDRSKVDVSYMTDEEYAGCMNTVFNSLEYQKVDIRKTRICKLSSMWRFLQVQYSLTETGRVIRKINPKRLTTMRRKMKKLVHVLSEKEFDDWFNSWFQNHYRIMSKRQRENMTTLYKVLKEVYQNVHNHTE